MKEIIFFKWNLEPYTVKYWYSVIYSKIKTTSIILSRMKLVYNWCNQWNMLLLSNKLWATWNFVQNARSRKWVIYYSIIRQPTNNNYNFATSWINCDSTILLANPKKDNLICSTNTSQIFYRRNPIKLPFFYNNCCKHVTGLYNKIMK